jgi:tetratricopeptide (TPR) repeat protein
MLASVNPGHALDSGVSMRWVLDEAARKLEEGSLKDQPEVEAAVRSTLGYTYEAQGLFRIAEEQFRQAHEIQRRLLGEEAPETLQSKTMFAVQMRRQGIWPEAQAILKETVETELEVLGREHPLTLTTMNNLAVCFWLQGKFDEAVELHTETLETQRRVLGENHVDTVKSMVNLGTVFWHQGKLEEAEDLLRKGLEKDRLILGEKHPETLKAMNNLGLVLGRLGRFDEAEQLYRETIAIQRAVLGEDHPETERTMSNLLNLLSSQGKKEAVRSLTLEKIAMGKRKAEDPKTDADSLNGFAWFLLTCEFMDLQDPEGALPIAERANELSGWKRPDYLDTLALAYQRTGRFEEAIAMQEKALILSHTEGSVDPIALEVRLIEYLTARRKIQKKIWNYLKPILAGFKKSSPSEIIPGEVFSLLGQALVEDHKFEEAEAMFLQGLRLMDQLPLEAKAERDKAYERVILFYEAWGKPEEAAALRNIWVTGDSGM